MVLSKVLLDSHVLIWLINGEKALGNESAKIVQKAEKVYVSAASIWELNIKDALGQMKLPDDFEKNIIKTGFVELPATFSHAKAIRTIKMIHGDPFGKLLVAQAQIEGLLFLTADEQILKLKLSFVSDARK